MQYRRLQLNTFMGILTTYTMHSTNPYISKTYIFFQIENKYILFYSLTT